MTFAAASRIAAAACLASALAACDSPEVTDDPDASADRRTCDATDGVRQHWLLTELRWGRVADGISDGFDLDGDAGEGGCSAAPDYAAPDGAPGIDNALGGLLPVLEATEFSAAEGVISELIRTGELMFVGELAGLDDPSTDDCVSLALRRGTGVPLLGTDGDPLPGQTLDLDTAFTDQEFTQLAVVDGRVEASPISVALPVTFLEADLLFEFQDGAIRFDLHDDGTLTGVLGGGLDVNDVVETIQAQGVAQELKDLAGSVLRFAADLAPNEAGACTQLSVVLAFEAQPVFVYSDLWAE